MLRAKESGGDDTLIIRVDKEGRAMFGKLLASSTDVTCQRSAILGVKLHALYGYYGAGEFRNNCAFIGYE